MLDDETLIFSVWTDATGIAAPLGDQRDGLLEFTWAVAARAVGVPEVAELPRGDEGELLISDALLDLDTEVIDDIWVLHPVRSAPTSAELVHRYVFQLGLLMRPDYTGSLELVAPDPSTLEWLWTRGISRELPGTGEALAAFINAVLVKARHAFLADDRRLEIWELSEALDEQIVETHSLWKAAAELVSVTPKMERDFRRLGGGWWLNSRVDGGGSRPGRFRPGSQNYSFDMTVDSSPPNSKLVYAQMMVETPVRLVDLEDHKDAPNHAGLNQCSDCGVDSHGPWYPIEDVWTVRHWNVDSIDEPGGGHWTWYCPEHFEKRDGRWWKSSHLAPRHLLPEIVHTCSREGGLRKLCGELAVEAFNGEWFCEEHAATERMNSRIAALLAETIMATDLPEANSKEENLSDLGGLNDAPAWIIAPAREPAAAADKFEGLEQTTVADFWQFALGDLRMNNARGYLAEFLVGRALGIKPLRRVEWDAYDLLLGDVTIEVKSSAYLQAWDQPRASRITFGGLRGTRYDPRHGDDPAGQRMNALVYVFCVQTAQSHETYNPLDLSQWEFYVVPRSRLDVKGRKSIGLVGVQNLAGTATPWADMAEAVKVAAIGEQRAGDAPQWWLNDPV